MIPLSELLDESGRPLFFDGPNPLFVELAAAGHPQVELNIPGLLTGPAILLATHLDGSMRVLPMHGRDVVVGRRDARRVRAPHPESGVRATDPESARLAWQRQNDYGLTENQVKVLAALVEAGDRGMVDHDHQAVNGLGQDTAGKRRLELARKGLVEAKTGDQSRRLTPRGSWAQVWVATIAGRQAMRPDRAPPPVAALTGA